MLDFIELEFLFEQFIEADSNPFKLKTKSVSKIAGQIQTKVEETEITLTKTSDLILDIMSLSENIDVEIYPKNWLSRLFQKSRTKKLKSIIHNLSQEWILITSQHTKESLKDFNIVVESNPKIQISNKILVLKRNKLFWRQSEGVLEFSVDWSCYKVIRLH
jgi:DNA-directed RNA polymerase subunit H (RpoH/RPB5)